MKKTINLLSSLSFLVLHLAMQLAALLVSKVLPDSAIQQIPSLIRQKITKLSMYALLCGIDRPNDQVLRRVNELFGYQSRALVDFAVALKHYTWAELDKNGIVTRRTSISLQAVLSENCQDVDVEVVASYLAQKVPPRMRYGNHSLMTHDIRGVIDVLRSQRTQELRSPI